MAENFERQKSTRWADAKVPSYGDDWGVDYNEDEQNRLVDEVPLPYLPTPINEEQPKNQSLDNPTDAKPSTIAIQSPDFLSESEASPLMVLSSKIVEDVESHEPLVKEDVGDTRLNKLASNRLGERVASTHYDPNPRKSTDTVNHDSDTYSSDHSDSDNDSIQQEPTELNLFVTKNLVSHKNGSTSALTEPEPLVLSVDRMNLYSRDDSSSDEKSTSTSEIGIREESFGAATDESKEIADDPEDTPYEQRTSNSQVQTRHRVKTEALDSLIDDLLRLEKLSLDSLDSNEDDQVSLNSDHRRVVPDVDSKECNSEAEVAAIPSESPKILLKSHESFISERDRRASIRKSPPLTDSPSDESRDEVLLILSQGSSLEKALIKDHSLDPVNSSSSFSTEDLSFYSSTHSPVLKMTADVSRKDSTTSSLGFTMASWKPNTNVFRDRFVSSNDNESHINMSILNEGESGYARFTGGTRPVSGYAESFTNSSCISVPDTVEPNLHSTYECEGDDSGLEIMSMNTVRDNSVGKPATSALLRESMYSGGQPQWKFSQESSRTDPQDGSGTQILSEEKKSKRLGATTANYPVFDWKKVMGTSQGIDRIKLLKKARADEEAYDTGLLTWLNEVLHSSDPSSSNIQIGILATQAYKNAPHNDIRRHISLRSKVSLVRDKMDLGASFGRRFLSRGKKLIKSGND